MVKNFVSNLESYIKVYKKEISLFLFHITGLIFLGYMIFKLFIYTFSQLYYKNPIKEYIFHSKLSYKLAVSLSEDKDVKEYLVKGDEKALKTFLSQLLLPNENIRIEIFNQNFVKIIDLPFSHTKEKNIFKVVKDIALPKVLSAGIGGYFFKPGEYGFEFSGISPIYYQNQIIGLIEIKEVYDKPVILPKKYKEYIKYAPIKEYGSYILINGNLPENLLKELLKKGKAFNQGYFYILKKYKDYGFIFKLDFHKFLLIFLSTYTIFALSYLLLVWRYIFSKKIESFNPALISKSLEPIPHIIFDKEGNILAMNKEKWEPYLGYFDKLKDILSFIKYLKVKNPLSFYENYFKNFDSYKEISFKLKDKYIKFRLLPLSSNLSILILDDLSSIYKRIKKLKQEKNSLEDLVNDLKVLLKTKNNKIAELKLQLYFLKHKNEKKENSSNSSEIEE